MFTGIIESTGTVREILKEGNNLRLKIACSFAGELKADQSVSHNGICLTVITAAGESYEVVAIEETLKRTNLGQAKVGDEVNLERSLRAGDRLDGHIVQGHVDTVARVQKITPAAGSHIIHFDYDDPKHVTVEKGSVCVNGISLTVVDSDKKSFSVAIIPYTWEHTNLRLLKVGDQVNVEFDIVGKYIRRLIG